jgi:hypothetical protein
MSWFLARRLITAVLAVSALALAACSSTFTQATTAPVTPATSKSASASPSPKASFTAKFDQAPALMGAPDFHGVATYTVQFDVTNTGKAAGTPVCVLLNSVQSTAVPNGNVVRTIAREAPGQTRTVFSGVAISGHGAAHAAHWSIHCQQGTGLALNK